MDSDILDSIENGDLKLVTSKDGNIYAQLRNSNGKFGKRLPIKKELEESGVTVAELQMALQVKTIEEQLHKIVAVLEDIDTKHKVCRLCETQAADKKQKVGDIAKKTGGGAAIVSPAVVGTAQKVIKDEKKQVVDVGVKAVEGFVKAIRKK